MREVSAPLLKFAPGNEPYLQEPTDFKRKFAGLICVLLIVANTVGQAEYTEYFYQYADYSSFLFLSWFSFIWLIICFPLFTILEYPIKLVSEGMSLRDYIRYVKSSLRKNRNYSLKNYMISASYLSLLNFLGLYLFYVPLFYLPVSIYNALYQSVIVFVFILSVCVLNERVNALKIFSVLLCIAGVIVICIDQTQGNPINSVGWTNTLIGCAITLLECLMDAIFEISFRKKLGDTNHHGVLLINSLCGMYGFFFGIVASVVGIVGAEPQVYFTKETTEFLFVSAAFAVSYFITYAFGMSVISPLYLNVSSLLALPVAAIIDHFLSNLQFSIMNGVGLGLVSLGVLLINIQSWTNNFSIFRRKKTDMINY